MYNNLTFPFFKIRLFRFFGKNFSNCELIYSSREEGELLDDSIALNDVRVNRGLRGKGDGLPGTRRSPELVGWA